MLLSIALSIASASEYILRPAARRIEGELEKRKE